MSKAQELFPTAQTVAVVKKELDKRGIVLVSDKKGGVTVKGEKK